MDNTHKVLSELYIQNYKLIYILNYNFNKQYIKAYFKYVDKIFIFFIGTNKQAKVMVISLNKNIQFTSKPK